MAWQNPAVALSPEENEKLAELGPKAWQVINLSFDWLHTFMPHCMKKVNRITFGLMTDEEVRKAESLAIVSSSRKRLAIPCVAKDVPSPAAEFAQPDVTIGLTCLAYNLADGGLRKSDFRKLLQHLQDSLALETGEMAKRKTAIQFSEWVREAGGEVCGEVTGDEFVASERSNALRVEFATLFLDSRTPESASGKLGEATWRDLSGYQNDVNLSPGLMSRTGGYYECRPPSRCADPARFRIGPNKTLLKRASKSTSPKGVAHEYKKVYDHVKSLQSRLGIKWDLKDKSKKPRGIEHNAKALQQIAQTDHMASFGLKWVKSVGNVKPVGEELFNDGLRRALEMKKLDFSKDEWAALGVKWNLEKGHGYFIDVGGEYFQPVAPAPAMPLGVPDTHVLRETLQGEFTLTLLASVTAMESMDEWGASFLAITLPGGTAL